MATIADIKLRANQVKNATIVGENTADRVGGVLVDLADHMEAAENDIANIDVNFSTGEAVSSVGIDNAPKQGSLNLVRSGGVFEDVKEVVGYDGAINPITVINSRLMNNNSTNYGYWYDASQRSLVYDLTPCKGKTINISYVQITNSYKYCIVTDYTLIPSSYDPTVFDPLVLVSGGKVSSAGSATYLNIAVPQQNCYLILSCSAANVGSATVICPELAIEPLSDFKQDVEQYMADHPDSISKSDLSLTGTNEIGVMPALSHRISSATVGSALSFGAASGMQSSHEYMPVNEGEIYYVFGCRANTIHAAVTDANNIVVASYGTSIYYAGMLKVEIPVGGRFLTWTTDGSGTLGWYVKVKDKKFDNYLLYEGETLFLTPQEIQAASTNVVCSKSEHFVDGINMIDCVIDDTSTIVIPTDVTKECKRGFFLYIEPSQVEKIQAVSINGNSLNVYSTFSYQDAFYITKALYSSTASIRITVTPKTGVTGSIVVGISSQMHRNRINKAVVCVNFDQSWQASVDSGAYDYIFNTANFPVTITGKVDKTIYDFESLLATGMLEIGMYGGNQGFEGQCQHITEGCSMDVINTHCNVKEDYYHDTFNITPRTFGGRQHEIDRKIIFGLQRYGFHSSRMRDYNINGGANYGGVIINGFNIVSRFNENQSNGGVPSALYQQAAINFFAHGLSTDGSGDGETKWSDFKSRIDYALQNVNNGAMLAMTFEQYFQTLLRFKLVAEIV